MITVACPTKVPPALKKKWTEEKANAKAAFAKGFPKTPFPFSAYKAEGVKATLEKTFVKKCAYCDSVYLGVGYTNIEHYRPKAEVNLEAKKKVVGYYWLAGEMHNLVPSCTHCNSESRHVIAGGTAEPVVVGKGNWFPIWDELKRANKEGDESKEYPLLLNPYRDDPEKYLEFGDEGLVRPIVSLKGKDKLKAAKSIHHYGLNRLDLVRLRKDWAFRVLGQVEHVLEAFDDWNDYPKIPKFVKRVIRNWKELQRLVTADQPYQAMSKRIVRDGIKATARKKIEALAKSAGTT